jgi:hypothetical protein
MLVAGAQLSFQRLSKLLGRRRVDVEPQGAVRLEYHTNTKHKTAALMASLAGDLSAKNCPASPGTRMNHIPSNAMDSLEEPRRVS